jgi:hypothetical protein
VPPKSSRHSRSRRKPIEGLQSIRAMVPIVSYRCLARGKESKRDDYKVIASRTDTTQR